ncbi:MAG TPA: hypothetical protein VFE62_19360 [Gemmataceae bacterium]|nr:hypothetical protein [Gemmataceae bacterium]
MGKVDYTGNADAPLVVVHLRDWHHVPRELCELEGIDFDANLKTVESVQEEELAIARHLIREHGLKAIYSEGLTPDTLPHLQLRLDLMKDLERLAAPGHLDAEAKGMLRELTLEVGVPGRLLHRREIAEVKPLEDRSTTPRDCAEPTRIGDRAHRTRRLARPRDLSGRRRALCARHTPQLSCRLGKPTARSSARHLSNVNAPARVSAIQAHFFGHHLFSNQYS